MSFLFLASLSCSAGGFVPYIVFELRGSVRTNPVSWAIWSLNGAALCVAHFLAGGSLSGAGVAIAQSVGPAVLAVIALLKFSSGDRGLTAIEKICGGVALPSLILSLATTNVAFSLASALLVEIFAAIPLLLHIWRTPREECLSAWLLFFVGSVSNIMALGGIFSGHTIVPWFFVVQSGIISIVLAARRIGTQLLLI